MGASISSVVAQLVLENLEETVISKLDYPIQFFFRYVNDCLLAVPENKKESILNSFNAYHQKLQFTFELEHQEIINFLDLTLIRKENKIETCWFTKETWSGRYLNFKSLHPFSQKKICYNWYSRQSHQPYRPRTQK